MSTLTFRKLHPDEAKEAYAIYTDAFAWLGAQGIRQWVVPLTFETYMQRQERGENYGLFIGDSLAAILSMSRGPSPYWREEIGTENCWWLATLAVSQAFKGQQAGETTMRMGYAHLAAQGGGPVFMDCVNSERPLNQYYERLGYTEVARKDITYPAGNTFNMILMKQDPAEVKS